MYNLELTDLQIEIERHQVEVDNLLVGYSLITDAASIKRQEGRHLVSENQAYCALVRSATVAFGSTKREMLATLPSSLDELSFEGFKAQIKEVSSTIWRAISDAAENFKKLMIAWYNKLKDLIMGTSNEEVETSKLEEFRRAIEASDQALKKHGYRRGDIVPPAEREKIKEAESVDLMLTGKGHVLTMEDFEKNIITALPQLKSQTVLLAPFAINGEVDNLRRNIEEGMKNLKEIANGEYLTDVLVYLRNMTNISSRSELTRFLDNDRRLTAGSFKKMVSVLRLEGGKEEIGSRWLSREMMGGTKFAVTYNKRGNFVYPIASRTQGKVVVKNWPTISLTELLEATQMASDLTDVVVSTSKSFEILTDELSKLTSSKGKALEDTSNRITGTATDREHDDVKIILSELKDINKIINGWVSLSIRIGESCKATKFSISNFSRKVSEEFEKEFALSGKARRK